MMMLITNTITIIIMMAMMIVIVVRNIISHITTLPSQPCITIITITNIIIFIVCHNRSHQAPTYMYFGAVLKSLSSSSRSSDPLPWR